MSAPLDYQVRQYLAYFIHTSREDIYNLEWIAKEGEKQYKQRLAEGHDGPQVMTTYSPDHTNFYTRGNTQPSRCTIPLAMTVLSSMSVMGTLLNEKGYNDDFSSAIKVFFDYANVTVTGTERDLLRACFRNGMMHTFLPQGANIGVMYDSSLDSNKDLFLADGGSVVLNVNRLTRILDGVFYQVMTDNDIHVAVKSNLAVMATQEDKATGNIIRKYKIERVKNRLNP